MFKKMSGNEVLLNLDNCENFRNGELLSGLVELGYRDANKEHDWNNHPIVIRSFKEVKRRIAMLNSKNIIQTAIVMDRLNWLDKDLWSQAAHHSLRLLHKYTARDLAMLLDLYDKDILDEEGEPVGMRKTSDVFFERIVALLPIQIKWLNKE